MKKDNRGGAPVAGLAVAAILLVSMTGYVCALSGMFQSPLACQSDEGDFLFDEALAPRVEARPAVASFQQSIEQTAPAWFLNALSNPRSRNPFVASFMYDSAGDRLGVENGYVGTLRDVFDVNLFGNISVFAGPSSVKTSGPTILAATATNEWTGTATSTWSVGSNWLGGTPPPSGGGSTLVLQFDASGATAYTATNDLGNPTTFSLNGYIFNSSSSGLITLANAASNTLTFVANGAVNPTITQSGSGAVTIDQSISVSAPLTITGTGSGTVTFSSGRSIGLGSRNLTIDTDSFLTSISSTITGATGAGGSLTKNGTGTLVLGTTQSTFTGGVTLNNGNLNLNADSNIFVTGVFDHGSLGIGTLTLAGGKIQSSNATAHTIANKVTITGDVTFGSTTTQTGALTFDAITGYTTPPTNPFTLGGAGSSQRTLTINVATTFVGAITQTNLLTGLIKTGPGTLTFGNGTDANANSYTGLTTINAGELDLNKAAGTNAIAGNIIIGDGSGTDILKLLLANQIANTSDVTINSSGVFNLNNNNETIDALNGVAGGSVTLGSGTLTVGANNEAAANFAGVISGTGGFIKVGLGGTQILSGTNLYSGDTQILAGDLRFDSGGTANSSTIRLGDTSGSNYAVLSLGIGSGNNVGSTLEVRAGSSGTKVLRSLNASGTNTYSGGITLNTGLTLEAQTGGTLLLQGGSLNLQSNTLTIDSQVVNPGTGPNGADAAASQGTVRINEVVSGNGGSIVKDGSGTLILEGINNTFTGGTTIKGGILGIYADGSLGTAPGAAADNIFFAASAASNPTATHILQDTSGNVSLGATRNINIASTITGTFDSNGNTFTVNGVINGGGNLNKTGAGTLVLTGENTYTGTTTVSQGTLNAAANGALGSGVAGGAVGTSGITVNSGGTLMLSNSSATDRVRDDAGIILGSGGPATIARSGANTVSEGSGAVRTAPGPTGLSGTSTIGLGSLTLQANSTLNFGTDGIGTLTFAGFTPGTFTLNILNWSSSSANFTAQTSGVDGANDRLIFGGTFNPLDVAFITFNGAPAGVVPLDLGFYEIVPIPEPGTWLGGALALGAIGFTQRRRLRRLIARCA